MTERENSRTLRRLRARWWMFFHKRCLVGFPWFWPARPLGRPAMIAARRMVRHHFGRDYHPVYRALARVLNTIAWPPAVLVHLWMIWRFEAAGAVPIKRVPGALWSAMRHNIWPCDYYAYALWRPDRRRNIDDYLYTNEAVRLFKALNRPQQRNVIDDKLAFYKMCEAHGVPTPTVLAVFDPTGDVLNFEGGRPPERDLFVKPRQGVGGEGAERFRWCGGAFESEFGRRLSPADFDGYLATRARSENRSLLVQPFLSNHPRLRVGWRGALATARLVTGRCPDDNVVAIFGFLYFSLDRRTAERWHVEGLINVATGRLVRTPLQAGRKIISGFRQVAADDTCILPEWDNAIQYVNAAHRACPNYVFVGWDIAFTHSGPVLLEGNANWSAHTYQLLSGGPLGHTKFAAVLAAHLDRTIPETKM